jgi:hypothetical protein
MAKISTYPLDSTPNLGDKLIGTDVNDSNATKNLTIGQILSVPGSSAYVPYTGATGNVDIGVYGLTGSYLSINTTLYADVTSEDDATSLIIGKGAGIGIAGTTNIGVGAGFNNTGDNNTFIGNDAGKMDTAAAGCNYNTAIGYGALGNPNIDYLDENTFVGFLAGADISTRHNTGVGSRVLSTGGGEFNTAMGKDSMYQQGGDYNSAFGWDSLSESVGDKNCAFGVQAGKNNTGDYNVLIGWGAGTGVIGSRVIAIGKEAAGSNNSNNVIAIGELAANTNTASEVIAIGGSALDQNSKQGSIGIGLSAGVNNSGDELIAIGREAGVANTGANLVAIGQESAAGNIGTGVIAIGFGTGAGNTFDNVVLLGDSVTATAPNQMVVLAKPVGGIKAATDFNNVTADRVVNFPNANGTFVLSVNGTAPNAAGNVTIGSTYSVYTAFLTYNGGGSFTVTQLENTIGDGSGDGINDIAWSQPVGQNGVFLATMTTGPFTASKTVFVNTTYNNSGSPYFVTGSSYFINPTQNYKLDLILHDGTQTGTPLVSNMYVEIRVYP